MMPAPNSATHPSPLQCNSIAWMGPTAESAKHFHARETIDATGLIAMPGFVDAHVHTAQQFLHGKIAAIRRGAS